MSAVPARLRDYLGCRGHGLSFARPSRTGTCEMAAEHRFERGTAVERVDDGRFTGTVDPGWAVIEGAAANGSRGFGRVEVTSLGSRLLAF